MVKAYIIGAGTLARQIYSFFHDSIKFIGFLDTPYKLNEKIYGLPVHEHPPTIEYAVMGVASPNNKKRYWQKYIVDAGCKPFTLKHPTAIISSFAEYDEGCSFLPYSIVGADVKLGKYVHLAPNALVGHNSTVGDFTTFFNFVAVGGCCDIEEEVTMFLGSTIISPENYRTEGKVRLGKGCVVAAGSVVTKSFPAGKQLMGVPAKEKQS